MAGTAEFEELKLSVVLIDDASSGLAALRTAMRDFEGDSIRFIRNARTNAEQYKRLGRETEDVVKGLRAAGTAFSRAAGVIGLAVGTYYKIVTVLSQFALEVEQVSNAARLAGVSYADLRNVAEQLARKGLSPESAGRVLAALNTLGLQLQTDAGIREFQNSILNSKIALDPKEEKLYIDAMIKARGFQERNAIVQNALRNIEKKGLEENLTMYQIRINQKEFLTKTGLPEELLLTGELAATTEAQKDKYNKIQETSKLWTDIIHKIVANVNAIIAIFNADSMDENSPFYLMLTGAVAITGYIDENLGAWLESLSDAGAELAKVFGGSPEGKGEEKPAEGLGDFMLPPAEPMSGDNLPVKLEKLIKEFRTFHDSLRGGGLSAPTAPLEQHASLGSMATPGLQLPPAAMAGDVYTDKYGIWPGGGAKPAGSDVGPGSGAGAGGGTGVGARPVEQPIDPRKYPWGPEGRFRSAPRGKFTRGGIPLFPPNRGGGGGAADGQDEPRGGGLPPDAPKIPGDFREPGGSSSNRAPDRSYSSSIFTPDYLAGTEPSTNIQDVRSGSWGGPGGAGGTSQPVHLMPPGWRDPEKSVFVPGLNVPAPFYPPATTDPNEVSIKDIADQPFFLRSERQQFEPGSMRDALQRNPNLYRRDAEYTRRQIELRQERQAAELNEPDAFRLPAPPGPRSGPGDLIPPGMDRRVLDQGMGNEMGGGGKLEGAKFTVDVNAPRGTEVSEEHSGVFSSGEMNRQIPMEE